jgi:hypothetical protein
MLCYVNLGQVRLVQEILDTPNIEGNCLLLPRINSLGLALGISDIIVFKL